MSKSEGTTRLSEYELAQLEEATPQQRQMLLSLLMMRKGEMLDELIAQLAEVVTAVEETGKPGKVSVAISVRPGGRGALTVTDDIAAKVRQFNAKALVIFEP